MAESIDYYFTTVSPFTYIGHRTIIEIAGKHDIKLVLKPMNMMDVWSVSEAVPPFKRPAVRQRYRLLELQRAAKMRGMKINHKPTNFPTDPSRADLCCAALILAGDDASTFLASVGEALWVHDRQIADEVVLVELLEANGHHGEKILEASKSDVALLLRNENSKEAILADAIGAPAYVYKDEVFWGQDRIEYLEAMIIDGRMAFPTD